MTQRTIIYLHSVELSQASFIICQDEEVEKTILRGHLSDLSPTDKQNEIIVVVPAVDVVLTEVSLPKLNHQRLMQALPFALEENLIDDVGQLHFAIADYQPNGTVPVAIVAQKKMKEWMALLRQYDIVPAQLYSAVFLLPLIEKNWSVSILQENATIRQNTYQGFSAEQANLPVLLELAIQNTVEKPECIHIYSTFATPVDLKLNSTVINEIHLSEQDWLETLPAFVNASHSINLLQGAYQAKHKTSETKKIWLLAAYAALIWIGLAFFSELFSFLILHHEASQLETRINHIYKTNFPESTSIISPRERMQSKLAKLEEQANTNYFLILLAKIGEPLSQNTTVQLKTLDFRDNQLTLELTANKFDDLDNFTNNLTKEGLTVKQQNATVIGDKVKTSLIIQRGSV